MAATLTFFFKPSTCAGHVPESLEPAAQLKLWARHVLAPVGDAHLTAASSLHLASAPRGRRMVLLQLCTFAQVWHLRMSAKPADPDMNVKRIMDHQSA